MSITVKVVYGDNTYRMSVPKDTTINDLQISISNNAKIVRPFFLKYEDDDEDLVVLDTDLDWNEAIYVCLRNKTPLKIHLFKNKTLPNKLGGNQPSHIPTDLVMEALKHPNSKAQIQSMVNSVIISPLFDDMLKLILPHVLSLVETNHLTQLVDKTRSLHMEPGEELREAFHDRPQQEPDEETEDVSDVPGVTNEVPKVVHEAPKVVHEAPKVVKDEPSPPHISSFAKRKTLLSSEMDLLSSEASSVGRLESVSPDLNAFSSIHGYKDTMREAANKQLISAAGESILNSPPPSQQNADAVYLQKWADKVKKLVDMGFKNEALNAKTLEKHNGALLNVVEELIKIKEYY